MDCSSLYKNTKKTGNYWANAAQFALTKNTLGVKVFQSFEAQLKENYETLEHANVFITNSLKIHHILTVNKNLF